MELRTYVNIIQLLLTLLICTQSTIAQSKKQTLKVVNLHGVVVISSSNIFVNNANIAVHNASGVLLASAQTNNKGQFTISNISRPASVELRITHSGYIFYKKNFNININKETYSFGVITLHPDTSKTSKLKPIQISDTKSNASSLLGTIIGKVRDSTYKYVLSSATVSVYNQSDSSLLKFLYLMILENLLFKNCL